MMDFGTRCAQAALSGGMAAGAAWVSHMNGRIFHSRTSRGEKHSQLRTVLGNGESADDTVTGSSATHAPVVVALLDHTNAAMLGETVKRTAITRTLIPSVRRT